MGAVGILGRQAEVEPMFRARRAVKRHVQAEAAKARGANQHEVRRFTIARLGKVAKTPLHEVAAGQPREIHELILQGSQRDSWFNVKRSRHPSVAIVNSQRLTQSSKILADGFSSGLRCRGLLWHWWIE